MVIREEKIGNLKEILNKWYTLTEDYNRDKADLNRQIAAAQAESEAVNAALEAIYAKINSLIGFTVKIVDKLPEPGEFGTVFFVKARNGKDYYEAWVWVDDRYEQVGAIDLSDYALKTNVESLATELRRTVSGSYNGLMTPTQKNKLDNIQDNANNYSLPTASGNTKGGVKVGSNLSMSGDTMNAKDTTYSTASQSSNGLMSAGDKKKLDGIAAGANNYSLPTASTTVKGGIKVGTGLSMNGDTLNCTVSGGGGSTGGSSYTLPVATSSRLGGVKVGSGLAITGDGVLSCTVSGGSGSGGGSSYTLPTASKDTKGGVKVGKGLKMNGETLEVYDPVEGTTTGDDNNYNATLYGNLQIFSWWSGTIQAQKDSWHHWHTLPKKNAGFTVWSYDINNTSDGNLYLRVAKGSNDVQYYSSKEGNIPITPGQLVIYVDAHGDMGTIG